MAERLILAFTNPDTPQDPTQHRFRSLQSTNNLLTSLTPLHTLVVTFDISKAFCVNPRHLLANNEHGNPQQQQKIWLMNFVLGRQRHFSTSVPPRFSSVPQPLQPMLIRPHKIPITNKHLASYADDNIHMHTT